MRHWFAFLSVLDFAAVQELLNLLYFTLILALFVLNNVRDFFWRFLPAALAAWSWNGLECCCSWWIKIFIQYVCQRLILCEMALTEIVDY